MTATPGHSIKGNISVASGATLNFNPASAGTMNLNGASAQTIGGAGTITLTTAAQTINIANSTGVVLNKDLSFSGPLTVSASAVLDLNSHAVTVASAPTLAGSLT